MVKDILGLLMLLVDPSYIRELVIIHMTTLGAHLDRRRWRGARIRECLVGHVYIDYNEFCLEYPRRRPIILRYAGKKCIYVCVMHRSKTRRGDAIQLILRIKIATSVEIFCVCSRTPPWIRKFQRQRRLTLRNRWREIFIKRSISAWWMFICQSVTTFDFFCIGLDFLFIQDGAFGA